MADTYTQLYYHVVFVVQGRKNLIKPEWKDELYKYITGITNNKKQTLMIINGMPDHIHILIGTTPDISLSDLLRDINDEGMTVFVITHEEEVAEQTKRIVRLKDGVIISDELTKNQPQAV